MEKKMNPGPVGIALKRFLTPEGPWSMRALSGAAQLSEKAVQAIIEGRSRNPRGDTLLKLAQALGTPLQALMSGEAAPGGATAAAPDAGPEGEEPQIAILTAADHRRACGARLRKLLRIVNMADGAAAALMGIEPQDLSRCLEGKIYPPPYALYRLCRAKAVDYNWVFLGDWSALPSRLASILDAELAAALAVSEAGEHQGAGVS